MDDNPAAMANTRVVHQGSVVSILVDGVEQSRVDLSRPEELQFEYMEQMDTILSLALPAPTRVRALHVGGCGCALAWAWHVLRPGSRQLAIEVDPEIAEKAREWLPLPRKPHLRIRLGEGREVLSSSQATYDSIVRDAFVGRAVPKHLQTGGWVETVRNHLRPAGLYLANAAHGAGTNSRPDVAATSVGFKYTAIVGESKVLKGARWGNVVIAAWNQPGLIDTAELDRRLRRLALPVSIYSGERLRQWLGGARPAAD